MKTKQQKRLEAEARAEAYAKIPLAQKLAAAGEKEKAKLLKKQQEGWVV